MDYETTTLRYFSYPPPATAEELRQDELAYNERQLEKARQLEHDEYQDRILQERRNFEKYAPCIRCKKHPAAPSIPKVTWS